MAVTADIPGIGNVQIQDAATEATLKDILAALKKGNKGGGGGSGGGGAGGGPGGMAGVMEKGAGRHLWGPQHEVVYSRDSIRTLRHLIRSR